jgi:type IV fimbrial biogenesis protein FimT
MSRRQRAWQHEHGFTLMEVIVTILIMGIVFAIASSTWFGVVESRRVDSATNQLAADLRLAHTTATNRLVPQVVNLTAGSSEYSMTGSPSPLDLDDDPAANEVIIATEDDADAAITFEPDGSAMLPEDACSATLVVSSADGDPAHDIEINAATSRIQIDPVDPAECI